MTPSDRRVTLGRPCASSWLCSPGELDARKAAVERAQARLTTAKADLARFRANQLRTRAKVKNARARANLIKAQNKAYAQKVKNLRAFEDQVKRAQAQLGRCD